MPRNVLETVLGAVVLVVAAAFLWYAYQRADVSDPGGYVLRAQFESVDGLENGSDVRISGIKVGQVLSQTLDPQTYLAEVRFSVASNVELPSDSSAAIASASLLGGKYLSLSPGGDVETLGPDGLITFTQPSINIERLIGQYVFGGGGGGPAGGEGSGAAPAPGAAPAGGGTDP
jgi:phospholipid/cholesterol/gamma-HCH transport system substrate-binding protein